MIGDVQDILHGGGNAAAGEQKISDAPVTLDNILGPEQQKKKRQQLQQQQRKAAEVTFKKPEGMHRELYALLAGNNKTDVAPLVPSVSATKQGGYMNQKARLGLRRVRSWSMMPFENSARTDQMKLYHWRRCDREMDEYPFARFNKVIDRPTFTDEEFDQHLVAENWTREATDHLLDLCARFDLRWYIVHDRWDQASFGEKTIEQLKERYYNLVNALTRLRNESEQNILHFDADHERRRKEQLEKLWNRTREQVEEEEFLIQELKKIEARRRERERKAQDLQKLISAADRAPVSPVTPSNSSANLALKKKTPKISRTASSAGPLSAVAATAPDFSGIRFAEMRASGPHLRSQAMKLPNIGQKKVKCIEQALEKLQLDMHPPASDQIVQDFNDLRSDIALLYELKTALGTCEYDIEALRHRYTAITGGSFEIPAHLRVSNAEGSVVRDPTLSTSKRRIADVMELQTPALPTRKRKAAIEQSNMLKKLRRS